MTDQEKLTLIDAVCKATSTPIHKDVLERVLKIIDLVDMKQGKTDLMDIIMLFKN